MRLDRINGKNEALIPVGDYNRVCKHVTHDISYLNCVARCRKEDVGLCQHYIKGIAGRGTNQLKTKVSKCKISGTSMMPSVGNLDITFVPGHTQKLSQSTIPDRFPCKRDIGWLRSML